MLTVLAEPGFTSKHFCEGRLRAIIAGSQHLPSGWLCNAALPDC